ncbi:DNA pilot protein [Blackfly microvirus SF02]|uniref:DNA pilot protein n=1 Tax=Blackfly microvirus SF02 TaxID=2576452 RepID=A0A4P8PKG8_9VIRU|nr:DNA pilot protein [Blackfly microvirus SF02]
MAWIGPVIGGALSAFGAISGQNSANATNVGLDKKNRDWQERMANTAVQRRMDDLRRANLNPALAAEGQGATTPSTSAPTVESKYKDAVRPIGEIANSAIGALQAKANINLTNASAFKATQEGRAAAVTAENVEKYGRGEAGTGALDWQKKWAETGKAQMEAKLAGLTNDFTASQLDQFNRMKDSIVQKAIQDQQAGKLDLDALRSFAEAGGLAAGKYGPIVKLIFDGIRLMGRK